MDKALQDIQTERNRQLTLQFDGLSCAEFDKTRTRDHWVSYAATYIGRAGTAERNSREGHNFREMMVKAGAIAAAAIEAYDSGYC